jgi:hypothetical protein
MYPCYIEYEAAYRRQELLHEAEMERSIPETTAQKPDLSDKRYFWHEALALPISIRDVLHANISQALVDDMLRRRTQSFVLMVASAAFGLGVLAGGWIDGMANLDVVLLFGCIVALAACIPVARRSLFLLRRRRIKLLLHQQ